MSKVSAIIPIYNMERFINQCLDSLINQTFKDIEIICVNDGSTDNSLSILQEYAQKDERIKIITQENQGQGVARNKGIDFATGKYIQFIDPDDWIELNAIETLYEYCEKYNADYVEFLHDRYQQDTDTFRIDEADYSYQDNKVYSNKDIREHVFSVPILTANKFYKKDFVDINNIRYDKSRLGEDHIVTIKARLLANRILFLNKILYHYRVNPNSSCNSISNTKLGIFDVITRIKNELISINKFNAIRKYWSDYIINFVIWNCYSIPQESVKTFDDKCKELFSSKEYKKYIQMRDGKPDLSLLEQIFSVKNSKDKKRKIITILGIKIKFKIQKRNKNG